MQNKNQNSNTNTNANEPSDEPSMSIVSQYIKELNFDNSNAPDSFDPEDMDATPPKIEIFVNCSQRIVRSHMNEVSLFIHIVAKSQDNSNFKIFDLKLNYAGLVVLRGVDNEGIKDYVLMIHVPGILFEKIQSLICDLTKDSGFKPLILEQMDFEGMYQRYKEQTNQRPSQKL